MFRFEDEVNDDPDYQQPASMSQKDEDMDDEDDKVTTIKKGKNLWHFCYSGTPPYVIIANEAAEPERSCRGGHS